jgi:hypothetical protein
VSGLLAVALVGRPAEGRTTAQREQRDDSTPQPQPTLHDYIDYIDMSPLGDSDRGQVPVGAQVDAADGGVGQSVPELTACLRTGRAPRVPRARTRQRGKKFVTPEVMISQRAACDPLPQSCPGSPRTGAASAVTTYLHRVRAVSVRSSALAVPGTCSWGWAAVMIW